MISLLFTFAALAAVCVGALPLLTRVQRMHSAPSAHALDAQSAQGTPPAHAATAQNAQGTPPAQAATAQNPQNVGARLSLSAAYLRRCAICVALALFAQMAVLDSFSACLAGWPAVLVALCAAALYWLCVLAHVVARGKPSRAQAAIVLPLLLLCALCAEVFVYNAKAFSTAQLTGTPPATVYIDETTSADTRVTQLRYESIGADVQNLHLVVGAVPAQRKLDSLSEPQPVTFAPEAFSAQPVTVRIFATDAANARELALTERAVLHTVQGTQLLTLHLSAPVYSLRVELDAPWYHSPVVLDQGLNVRAPLRFSLLRVLILFALGTLAWLLRPRSFIWAHTLNFNSKRQRICFALTAAICVCVLWGAALLNTGFYVNPQPQDAQYQELARSLANSEVSIGAAPDYLAQMENPYDTALRDELAAVHAPTEHVGYRFDVAYFAGKYYVYFGIVPVLLLYLPFHLLTGADMPNILGALALLPLYVGGVWLLLCHLARRCFARVPAALFACICATVSLCSSAMFLAKRPDFYALPILTALVLTLWGLYFWLRALASPCARLAPHNAPAVPHSGFLLAGSLCMALVAGCRPQMILFSALIFPIFWHSVFRDRTLFSKKGWRATVCAAAPYALVAAGLMYYNLIRFGSPLEFGAQYNLTVADMTQRGLVFGRTGSGLFQYLLQPPVITAVFPFVQPIDSSLSYLGYVFNDPPFGGLLFCNPFLWALALLPRCKQALRQNGLWGFTLTALGTALVIVVADIQMGGVLQRYFSDFGVMAFVAAALVALTAAQQENEPAARRALTPKAANAALDSVADDTANGIQATTTGALPDTSTSPLAGAAYSNALRTALLCALAASLVYSILQIFMGSTQALLTMNPTRFYRLLHAVCFWV